MVCEKCKGQTSSYCPYCEKETTKQDCNHFWVVYSQTKEDFTNQIFTDEIICVNCGIVRKI